ncbi:MAG TPA: YHYH protein [Usitatibacter sp.]|nr:YHYH protein [Usitatibacter sp.]
MRTVLLACACAAAFDALAADKLDPRALPLGDGRVSDAPRRGYVFSCMTAFRGGGAQHTGDWVHGSTWDSTRKIAVRGDVSWPDARFEVTAGEGGRRVSGNGLPVGHATGSFPIGRDDPAFQIDRNPNAIEPQQVMLTLPRDPVAADPPRCVPMGMIGVTLDGVAMYNALDAAGKDAAAHEVQDRCNGHPQRRGEYHYHGPSPCIPGASGNNKLIGYALDGFGIYSGRDDDGNEITNADLDECHGRTSPVEWDGHRVSMYHYVMTREYPYSVGCFRGTPRGWR